MKEMSTQPMTAEELLEIIGKATPGEWRIPQMGDGGWIYVGPFINNSKGCLHGGTKVLEATEGCFDEELPALRRNIKAIAALHNHAPRIIRELLARVAELEAMVTPKPIEEAPKDERVLVFCPEESDYGYTAAWVIGEYVLHSWEGDSRLEDGVQPTHWLPLPPDPTEVTK